MSTSSAFSTCLSLIVTSQVRNGTQFLKATTEFAGLFWIFPITKMYALE